MAAANVLKLSGFLPTTAGYELLKTASKSDDTFRRNLQQWSATWSGSFFDEFHIPGRLIHSNSEIHQNSIVAANILKLSGLLPTTVGYKKL